MGISKTLFVPFKIFEKKYSEFLEANYYVLYLHHNDLVLVYLFSDIPLIMKTFLIILILLSTSSFSIAQLSSPFEISHDDSIPGKYKFDASKFSEKLYAGIPEENKKGIHDQMSHVFSCEAGYEVSDLLYGGRIYYHKNELTDYLNEVLRRVLPPQLKNDTSIKAYLAADGNYNAFMTPTGHMFIFIGLITEIPDEATLAAIMAHETAHYYLHHSLYQYFASESGMLDFGLLGVDDKNFNRYSSRQELSADSLAIRWLKDSDYNIDGIMRCFEINEMVEKNYQNRSESILKRRESDVDHPATEVRLAKLKNYYNKFKSDSGSYFLVNEKKFKKFQNDIKSEVLNCLLNDAQYSSCIEKAFKYHLFEPYNVIYLRYLLEALRRYCYLDRSLWSLNFVTGNLFETTVVNNVASRAKMKDDLFASTRYNLLGIGPEDVPNIKATFYWNGEPKFKTNEQAFTYFFNICQSFHDHESVLTNALSFADDTVYRNKYLKKYLTFSDAKYREYAEYLLKDSLLQVLQPQKLLVLSDFTAQIRLGSETISLKSCLFNENGVFEAIVDSIAKKRGVKKSLCLADLKKNNLKDYNLFIELQESSLFPIYSKGHKAEIQLLNPEFWQFFKKYGVNQIEFLNCSLLEDRKWDKNMDAFLQGQKADFKQIVGEKYHTCSFQNIISQIRMQCGKTSQFSYYEGSRSLNANEQIQDQLVTEIVTQLASKDKESVKYDNWIKSNKTLY